MPLVFVYGTLRQGGMRAIPKLFPQARFVGFGTVKGWLHDFGDYPRLIYDLAGRDILGEVYDVDEAVVQVMDKIEGYVKGDDAASDYFRRARCIAINDGSTLAADLYKCNPHRHDCTRPMPITDWIAWTRSSRGLP